MRLRKTILNSELRVSKTIVRNGFGHVSRFTFHPSLAAFTLIEIMVVVVLMSVIILGLVAMFSYTQRAFKAGMAQTDVLEGGRMVTEMLARELEQTVPAYSTMIDGQTNFYTLAWNEFSLPLTASSVPRTNRMNDLFFLTHENQTWKGIGYFWVADTTVVAGGPVPVGLLNRFEMTNNTAGFNQNPWLLIANFYRAAQGLSHSGNVSKIIDGVVSFNFRTYDTDGYVINPFHPGQITNNCSWVAVPDRVNYHFTSNAVPAFVEFELGLLEPGALDHYKSLPIYQAQTNYFAKQDGRIHLFRQRVAVRNVDRSAY